MPEDNLNFSELTIEIWTSGGWLMIPLFILTVFIYFTALELLLRVNSHFLLKKKVHKMSDHALKASLNDELAEAKSLILRDARSTEEVKWHFVEVRNEYLPIINRRLKFLAIIITTGPLIGLLGTVTGMLSTFNGMVSNFGSKFDNIVKGISEALITTQTGLIISIPAFVILSIIIQRRNHLERCIARLERYNFCVTLKGTSKR